MCGISELIPSMPLCSYDHDIFCLFTRTVVLWYFGTKSSTFNTVRVCGISELSLVPSILFECVVFRKLLLACQNYGMLADWLRGVQLYISLIVLQYYKWFSRQNKQNG